MSTKIHIKHPKIILFILGSATALMPLSIDMYLPAFPHIAADLSATISTVEFSLTSFFIGVALGQLFYGPIADRYGRKTSLYIGLSLGAITSLACAFIPDIHILIGVRFLQALGICAGAVTSRAIVRDMFDHHEAARYFSLLIAIMGIAPILAPTLGGYIAQYLGWHAIFLVTAAASLLCLLAIKRWLPETHPPDTSVHISRAFHTYFGILRDKAFIRLVLAGGFAMAGLFAYITGSPFVLINYYGIPAERYGLIFGLNAIGLIGCSQLNRKLLKHFGFEHILKAGFIIILVVGTALVACGLAESGIVPFLATLFCYIASIGMVSPNSMAGAMATQGRHAGSASAMAGSIQFGLAFIASAAIGSMKLHSPAPLCLVMGACAFLSFGITQLIRVPKIKAPEDVPLP